MAALCLLLAGVPVTAGAAQRGRPARSTAPLDPSNPSASIAEAYDQFLIARRLERDGNIDAAIAAYKRAASLDPSAGEVTAGLASLYLGQNRIEDALKTAEQSLKVSPDNVEAHRVLGLLYAALSDADLRATRSTPSSGEENAKKAIDHLEAVVKQPDVDPDPNLLAYLARLYVRTRAYDKAIPVLHTLVSRERGWQEGVGLLTEAYAAAGKNADAIAWLETAAPDDPRLYATLGEFYDRERRWKEAAGAYAIAVQQMPRNVDLKLKYCSALLSSGERASALKARDVLTEVVSARPTDTRALYLLAQAHRRSSNPASAEATARKLIGLNKQSPWGYYALAEALQDRQQYQAVIDSLVPAINEMRSRSSPDVSGLGLLLPHVGFAYEQLGQFDSAIASFDEAHRLAPSDGLLMSYLIQANLSAKKYGKASELAESARVEHPDDLRLARLEAQALRLNGQPDKAIEILRDLVGKQGDRPQAYVMLAQMYVDANRGSDAVKLLDEAQAKFPTDVSIGFELGAALEKQKRYGDAEAAFRQVLANDPDNAPTLNYLGYMLADRGERLDESIAFLKKALEIDPENGSYLDSLGWAYYKSNKFDLAVDNLKRAADQLKTNSVIQDHYGDVLFKLGRFDEAVAAWTRALDGDGDSVSRLEIDKKIRSAQQKAGKK
jgi:tetratricopeptide (TPR) repeat protein